MPADTKPMAAGGLAPLGSAKDHRGQGGVQTQIDDCQEQEDAAEVCALEQPLQPDDCFVHDACNGTFVGRAVGGCGVLRELCRRPQIGTDHESGHNAHTMGQRGRGELDGTPKTQQDSAPRAARQRDRGIAALVPRHGRTHLGLMNQLLQGSVGGRTEESAAHAHEDVQGGK